MSGPIVSGKTKRRPGGGRKPKAAGFRRAKLCTSIDERALAELERRVAESGQTLPDWLSEHFMPPDIARADAP